MSQTAQMEPQVLTEPPRSVEAPQRRRAGRPALRFLVQRLGAGVLTLLVASMLIYGAVLVIPGDVSEVVLGRNATPDRIQVIREQLQLDQPAVSRYGTWLGGMLTGDLGLSTAALVQGQEVSVASLIGSPMRNSLTLAALTVLLFVPIVLALATFAALRAGRPSDHAVSLGSLAIGSMPEFLIGTLLIVVFFSELGLLPAVSTFDAATSPLTQPDTLVLPIATLLLVCMSFGIRMLRASIVEVLRDDYVTMARLNGIRERRVIFRYVLRNALAPSIQVLAQTVQYLVGGIIIVESLFNYPGIGKLLVQSVLVRDPQMVSVIGVLLAAIYLLVNIVADLLVVFVVPRLRTQL